MGKQNEGYSRIQNDCSGCMKPCGFCENESFDFFFDPDVCGICMEDPCSCFDDVCCFDPMYTGLPGTCHCKAFAEAESGKNRWYHKIDFWIWGKWFKLKSTIRNWNIKIVCGMCGETSLRRKWKDNVCPNCNDEDLPF